jgi:hypothetical protein
MHGIILDFCFSLLLPFLWLLLKILHLTVIILLLLLLLAKLL